MLGDYRIVDNVLVCVLHKQAVKKVKILYSFLKILFFILTAIFYIFLFDICE